MKHVIMIAIAGLLATSCSRYHHTRYVQLPCQVIEDVDGAHVSCPTSDDVFIPFGRDGKDGVDGKDAVIEVIDPCGDDPNNEDEVILRLSSGDLLAYFKDGGNKEFLAILEPGDYVTTDKQQCRFRVTEDLQVVGR